MFTIEGNGDGSRVWYPGQQIVFGLTYKDGPASESGAQGIWGSAVVRCTSDGKAWLSVAFETWDIQTPGNWEVVALWCPGPNYEGNCYPNGQQSTRSFKITNDIPFVCIGGQSCNGVPHPGTRGPSELDPFTEITAPIFDRFGGCIITIAAHYVQFIDTLDRLGSAIESYDNFAYKDKPFRGFLTLLPGGSCFLNIVDLIAPGQLDALDDCMDDAVCRGFLAERIRELLSFETNRGRTDGGGGGVWSASAEADSAIGQPARMIDGFSTWIWGPQPNTGPMYEYYQGSSLDAYLDTSVNDWRIVQYFDKSRMEINDPNGDTSSEWYITNGLLAKELITGEMQVGDSTWLDLGPAQVNVAGDADDETGPTYGTMFGVLSVARTQDGALLTERIDRAGVITSDPSLSVHNVTAVEHVVVAGIDHQIASPFWEFMTSTGYESPFYVTGYPITEAYWANVKVGGVYHDVLMQCFERRCMTYNPSNSPEWQVEMGNIGQHYYEWRYGSIDAQ